MRNKTYALTTYILVFFACLWNVSSRAQAETSGEYNRHMKKLSYQLNYTDTYSSVYSPFVSGVSETVTVMEESKMVYLTFDDGPSPRTPEILDVLKKHDVKATFFVINSKEEYIPYLQRAIEEGHTIGVHSASHKYKEIYRSVDAYLEDFTKCYKYIFDNTGYEATIFRFPGGSVNNYNSSVRKDIALEMSRRGFIYFDWNVESNDSRRNMSVDAVYNNVINGCNGKNRAVVIMHDSTGKKSTVQALDRIITKLKEDGWQFAALTNEIKPVIFRMK